jgi:uridine kinase
LNDKIIISICGAAGAGKSTLAKKLVKAIGENMATRIPGDYYLKSYNGEPFEEFMKTPFKYDWELVKKVIDTPIGLQAETPDFDFNKLIRVDKKGGKPFTVRRYMIIDTMLPYPKSNYIIKITAPEDLRLKKVKERDKAQKLNSARNWEKMEKTAEELDKLKYKFDLIVSGFDEPEVNAEKIKNILRI